MDWTANVEINHRKKLDKLIQTLSLNNVQSQYKGDFSNNKNNDAKEHPIIKWVLEYLLGNTTLLGDMYWYRWRDQTGDYLDKSIMFNFGISRYFGNIRLTDAEYIDLANFAELTLLSKLNFNSIANIIANNDTSITGILALRHNFIYYSQNLSNVVLQTIIYNKLLIRPFCNTWLINFNVSDEEVYYWRRNGNLYYNKNQSTRTYIKDNNMYGTKYLNAFDVLALR